MGKGEQGPDASAPDPETGSRADSAPNPAPTPVPAPGVIPGAAPVAASASGPTAATTPAPDTAEPLPPAPVLRPAADPRARRRRRRRRVLVSMTVAMAVLATTAAVSAYVLYRRLDGQITTEEVAEKIGPSRPPVMPEAYGSVNILLMGSDDRTGENIKYGDIGEGTKRSDTTILLHLAADRKSSVAVSIPRDLMVQIPSCVRDDGTASRAYKDQFNHAFEIGGSACTIKTVELLTQVQIDHHIVIDFTGFKRMVDAVDGVDVCLTEPLRDQDAKLDLAAGRQELNGEQSLAYVRARKQLGDGSDTQRMVRQQRFLASLFKKVKSNGVLMNPMRLYELLDAGTRSIAADPGLDSLEELAKLSRSVSNIPADQSAFLTVPRQQYRLNTNRDELVQPDADMLFTAIRYDRVAVGKPEPGAKPEPGGSVRIDNPPVAAAPAAGPSPSAGASWAPGRGATAWPTRKAGEGATSRGTMPPGITPDPSGFATHLPTSGATPGAPDATGTATTGTDASGSPLPSGTASPTGADPSAAGATASASPAVPAGPIVTVTGRTVDQDVCA